MTTQAEAILEKNLVEQLAGLGSTYATVNDEEKGKRKNICKSRVNNCIFATTVPMLHTIRTAHGSFFLYVYGI